MRILFCTENLLGGGKERRLSQLIIGLHRKGIQNLSLITLNQGIDYPEILGTNIDIYTLDQNTSYLYKLKEFYKIVRTVNPDIVHSWSVHMSAYFVNILNPFMKFKNIAGFIVTAQRHKKWSELFFYEQLSFLFADAVIANSFAGLEAKIAPKNKTCVINNGFDFCRLENLQPVIKIRETLNIKTRYIVSMVGRVNIHKDYKMYVEIASAISKLRTDVTFLIVGKGDMENEIEDYIDKLNVDNIQLIGFRNDVESIINASDICILCSNPAVCPEGISNFIVESMALKKPVIATRGGGTDEIVIDGHNGFLVESKDVKLAINHIIKLLDNDSLRIKLGANGNQDIKNKYLLNTMVEKYLTLYRTFC